METAANILSAFLLILGTLLSVIGVIGFIRMPDVYTRLHATGKVSVFGLVFLLLAMIFIKLDWAITFKGVLLIFFVLLSSPSVAHSIASAAYKVGIPMANPQSRDELKQKLPQGRGKDV